MVFKKSVLKQGSIFLLIISLLVPFVAADTVTLTPADPSRVDMLTCTYTVAEPGVFLFEFFKNGEVDQLLFERETDKRTVAYRLQGLQNRDTVTCAVSKRDVRGEFNGVGSAIVTVGAFQCNDLNDNDGDTRIDMQDPGCKKPTDSTEQEPACSDGQDNDRDDLIDLNDPGCMQNAQKEQETNANGPACDNGIDDDGDRLIDMRSPGCEDPFDNDERIDYETFCREHSNNIYCKGLGMNDWLALCHQAPQQPVCNEENLNQVEGFCQQNPDHRVCTGVDNLAEQCQGRRGDFFCGEVQAQMIFCRDGEHCIEITNDDEEILCGIRAYDFCPQQAAGIAADQPAPAAQPPQQNVQNAEEQEESRREEIRKAIEEEYRDIQERQRRAAEQEQRARAVQPAIPIPPSQPPQPPEDLAAKKELRQVVGKRAGGLPTTGVIAAGGIIAVLAAAAYAWARSRQRQPIQPQSVVQAPAPVKTMKMKIRRQHARQARKRKK